MCPQVTAIAFHPSGATMSSADEDGTVITWDLATSKRLATAEKHKGPIWSLAYSQGGGKLLASGEGPLRQPVLTSHTTASLDACVLLKFYQL